MTQQAAPLNLVVVSAGLGVPSSSRLPADRITESVRRELADSDRQVRVGVVELRDLAVAIADNLVTGFPAKPLADAIEEVTGADGLTAVTPVFTASYSGLFKSFFDLIEPDALTGEPVLIAATGGTARHSPRGPGAWEAPPVLEHALRPLFACLRALVVPTAVYAASEDWGGTGDALTDALPDRIARAGREPAALMAPRTTAEPDHATPTADLFA